jgi:hypothetical protein
MLNHILVLDSVLCRIVQEKWLGGNNILIRRIANYPLSFVYGKQTIVDDASLYLLRMKIF